MPLLQGVYFADMMSKSANYCHSSLSQNTGLLLLAEVAVAPFHDLTQAKYDADVECKAKNKLYVIFLPNSSINLSFCFTSQPEMLPCGRPACLPRCVRATKGVGRMQPVGWGDCADILGNDELIGVKMPNGPGVENLTTGSYLQYNEVCIHFIAPFLHSPSNVADISRSTLSTTSVKVRP
jgi:poly [ADP-ribose] polymerase